MNSLENTSFKINKKPFHKTINAPTSKSYSNRALICAAFSQTPVKIFNLSDSTDVITLKSCLEQIGIDFKQNENELIINNSFPECEKLSEQAIILDSGDGGTTNRFLLALLALGKNKYILKTKYGMSSRPMTGLLDALKELSVEIETSENEISIQGPPPKKIGKVEVDCEKSSQFASAMLMAFPTVHLIFKNLNTSKKYFEMTRVVSKEIAQKKFFQIPFDWSSLSYPIAMAVTLGSVILKDVKLIDELQADSVLMQIIRSSGAKITSTDDGLKIEQTELKPFEIDCSDCPDLVPTLSFLASTIKEPSYLKNIKVLRFKESDRLQELFKIFELFNVKYSYDEDKDILKLSKGDVVEKSIEYQAPADHRMIMTAYLFMRYHQGGEIFNYQHVNKSYPNFFNEMES